MSETNPYFADLYPDLDGARQRILILENELAACAKILQRVPALRPAEGIGLLECAAALNQLFPEGDA